MLRSVRFLAPRLSQRLFSTHLPVTLFSEEEESLRQTVSKFAEAEIKPHVRLMDETQKLRPEILTGLFSQGFMAVEVPSEYEGAELNFTSSCIVIEELAKVDPGVSVMCDVQNTLITTSMRTYGNPDQKKKYLPRLATDTVGSFCLSEAGSGSDAFALKATAVQSGNDFILNGSKSWITNAEIAGLFIVFANVNPAAGYKGITAFIVEKGTEGLVVGRKEDKLGIRSSSTCEVRLVDCKVSKDAILGKIGEGYKIAIKLLNEGRIGIAAQMLGLAEGAWDFALPYMHQRRQFGQPIANFQGMEFQIAQIATDIECAKLLTYNAARLKEQNRPFVKEAAMAKLTASAVAERTASMCIDWMGGVGFTKDFIAEKFYRDCKVGKIYEGTSNIQLLTIAKEIHSQYK